MKTTDSWDAHFDWWVVWVVVVILVLMGAGFALGFSATATILPRAAPLYCTVHRSSTETARFKRLTGYASRPGYVVDHIVPLCACGRDSVSNMQWQRRDSSLVKDKWELQMCRALAADTLK